MEQKFLESKMLYAAFITACKGIVEQREKMNAINLFPVADGDTGDNMAATALSIIHNSQPKDSLKPTLQSLSNAAIAGARGNSGMIFSQFFNGLVDYTPELESLNTEAFANWILNATKSVRQAILNPVEGTIITVMDAWASKCMELASSQQCFLKLLEQSMKPVEAALKSTSSTLEVLKKANVVDAGALGFYHFICGFNDYISNPREIPLVEEDLPLNTFDHHFDANDEPPCNRYCTEAMLSADNLDRSQLAKILEAFGDCVVLSGNQKVCRFHVHCNEPAKLFTTLKQWGDITQPKVDDMLRQFEVAHDKKRKIALVTDSSANLTQEILDKYQVHLIPLNLHLDDHHVLDHYCIEKEKLYDELSSLKNHPTTSMPNPGKVKEKINYLAKNYDNVLILSLSQPLSGTHDMFVKSSEHAHNIHVINTKHTAGSLGLLVQYAAELIDANNSIEDIISAVEDKIRKTKTYVLIDQFDSLIRSGRISKTSARIASFANIKPIISLDEEGKIFVLEKVFNKNKALIKMVREVEKIKKDHKIMNYNIIHANAPEKAKEFSELTTESFAQSPDYIETVASVIGLHAGPGCVALSVMFE